MGYLGRMAPSPTGLLHLGHVRAFGAACARAREAGGTVRLRVDDLDRERSRAEFERAMLEDLQWLGLGWTGEPWRQSARAAEYRRVWERLVKDGWVYPCVCSRRELAGAPHEEGGEVLYPGTCRDAARPVQEAMEGVSWRFRVPDGEAIRWADGAAGEQNFMAGREFGDFVIWRRDGTAAYQLACVVDDVAMGVTEVVRGADLLLSTARQMLLYRALGFVVPAWFHVPLVLGPDGRRLAKRDRAASVRVMRERGMTPEAVLAAAGVTSPGFREGL